MNGSLENFILLCTIDSFGIAFVSEDLSSVPEIVD